MADDIDKIYQAPKTTVDHDISNNANRIWRKKSLVVMTRETNWPKRCIKCNAPTDKTVKRLLVYLNPWIYLSILISFLITIVLALIYQKKFKMEIPLCDKHIQKRKRVILANVLLFLITSGGLLFTIMKPASFVWVIPVLAIIAMLIIGLPNRLAYIKRYKDPYIFIRGAKREFLYSLDEFNQ